MSSSWRPPRSTLVARFSVFVDEFGDDESAGGFGTLNGSVTATAVTLTGNVDADTLSGTGNDDTMFGLGGNDTLIGFGGGDQLSGGTGLDTMIGGLGDDIYIADLSTDVVTEAVGEGTDTVLSSATYFLSPNVENLTPDRHRRHQRHRQRPRQQYRRQCRRQRPQRPDRRRRRCSAASADDTYVVDNAGDTVTEVSAVGGNDLVESSVTFTLGRTVENLDLDRRRRHQRHRQRPRQHHRRQ